MECHFFSIILCIFTNHVWSANTKTGHSTSKTTKRTRLVAYADKEPIDVARECADFGRSVGRLRYRVWREGGALVAECALGHPPRNMRFSIAWMVREESGFRKVLRQCEFNENTNKSEHLSCQYKLTLPRAQDRERISCWVYSVNEWGAETATSCASDEITLVESAYRHWKSKIYSSQESVLLKSLALSDLTRRKLNPKNMFDVYIVHIEPYEQFQVCKADLNSQMIMKIAVVPNLDFIPQSITWNCTLSFETHINGSYTLTLITGNASDPHYTFGTYMKTCRRAQVSVRKSVRCETAVPITVDDEGQHIFHCLWIRENETCRSVDVKYNISTVKNWEEHLRREKERALAAEKERQRWLAIPEHYRTERNRTNLIRDVMPWNVLPVDGKGALMNAKQYAIMGSGAILFLMVLGGVFGMILTSRSNKKERMAIEPCPCHLPQPVAEEPTDSEG